MANNPELVYWDSCVFIDWLKRNGPYAVQERIDEIRPCVEAATGGKLVIVTSVLALSEVIYVNGKVQRVDHAMNMEIVHMFKQAIFAVRAVDAGIAETARNISRETGLKPADAIHLATCDKYRVPTMYTYDDADLVPLSGRYGNPRITIVHPNWPAEVEGCVPGPEANESGRQIDLGFGEPDLEDLDGITTEE